MNKVFMLGIFLCSLVMAQAQVKAHYLNREYNFISMFSKAERDLAIKNDNMLGLIADKEKKHTTELYFSDDKTLVFVYFNGFNNYNVLPLKINWMDGPLPSPEHSLRFSFTSTQGKGTVGLSFTNGVGPTIIELEDKTIILY